MIATDTSTAVLADTNKSTDFTFPEPVTAGAAIEPPQEGLGTLPSWYDDAPSWVSDGAQKMLDSFYFCDGEPGVGDLYGTVVTSTSAVHFGGCRAPSGEWTGGATAYMQPSPAECAWSFYYQTVCGSDEVTLVWQIGQERGFVPDVSGITRYPGPDFELSGRHAEDGRELHYRYMGEPHLGYSTLTNA